MQDPIVVLTGPIGAVQTKIERHTKAFYACQYLGKFVVDHGFVHQLNVCIEVTELGT